MTQLGPLRCCAGRSLGATGRIHGEIYRGMKVGVSQQTTAYLSPLYPRAHFTGGGLVPFAPVVWQTPACQPLCTSASCLLLSNQVSLLQKSLQLSTSENKRQKKRRRRLFLCQITELNPLTEGAGTSSEDEQGRKSRRGERPPLFGGHEPFGWPTLCGLEHSRCRAACSTSR